MLGRWEEALARFAEIPDEPIGKDVGVAQPGDRHPRDTTSNAASSTTRAGCSAATRSSLARATSSPRVAISPALAAVRLVEGDYRAALAAAEDAFATTGHARHHDPEREARLHARARSRARALGDHAKANELLEIVEALPPGLSSPFFEATAHRFRAQLAGDDPGADRHFTGAAAHSFAPRASVPPRRRPARARRVADRLADGPTTRSRCWRKRATRSSGCRRSRGSTASMPLLRARRRKSEPE